MFHSRPAWKVRAVRPRLEVLEGRTLPSTYVVDHLTDDAVGSGLNGSLRYCINHAAAGDHITFGVQGTITLTSGQLAISRNLDIEGPGADQLVISGNNASRVFLVAAGVRASLDGLTITNGRVTNDNGGGIFVAAGGSLSVSACNLTGCIATITPNGTARGGGIYSLGGMVMISNCTLTGNTCGVDGGSLSNDGGQMTVSASSFSGNSANSGGGIYNGGVNSFGGTLTVTGCTFTGGLAANGGGLANDRSGVATVTTSSFIGNFALQGGAIYNASLGGGVLLTVSSSTFTRNTAITRGGGIYNTSMLTVSNSTFNGNSAVVNDGGGIDNDTGTLTVSNSTISDNGAPAGAGIFTYGTLNAVNTIIAGNHGDDLDGGVSSGSHNLIGGDPLLGPLQDNGGPTQTMALLPGSPALNAGDPAQLGTADQRGVARSGGVNIGAYQASASALVVTGPATATAGTPFDLTVQAVDPFLQTAVGYTGTVTFSSADPYGATLPADYTFSLADGGVHTFASGATLYTAGTPDVTATDTVTNSLTGSAFVTVNPAAADHLLFLQQPTDTAAGQTISPVMVEVVDAFGNVETGDNSDTITLSLGANPSGGTLSGTLTVVVVNGVATFGDLSIDLAGTGYTLHASIGGGLPDTDSNPFNVTM
jgi:predicted outer membrane repeat protein